LRSTHTDSDPKSQGEHSGASSHQVASFPVGVEPRLPLQEPSSQWTKTQNSNCEVDGPSHRSSPYVPSNSTAAENGSNSSNTTEPVLPANTSAFASRADNIRFENGNELEDKNSRESYGLNCSDIARKSPPPYHVAARRAAFFRSSGGAGSSGIPAVSLDFKPPATYSPVYSGRLFPVPSSKDDTGSSWAAGDSSLVQPTANNAIRGGDNVDLSSAKFESETEPTTAESYNEERKSDKGQESREVTVESVVTQILNSKLQVQENAHHLESRIPAQSYDTPGCNNVEYESRLNDGSDHRISEESVSQRKAEYEVVIDNINDEREKMMLMETEKITAEFSSSSKLTDKVETIENNKPVQNLNTVSNFEAGSRIPKFASPKSQIPQSFQKKIDSPTIKDGQNNNITHVANSNSRIQGNVKPSGGGESAGSKIPKFSSSIGETPEKPRLPSGKPETAPKPVFLDRSLGSTKIPSFGNANELRKSDRDIGQRFKSPTNIGSANSAFASTLDNSVNSPLSNDAGSKIPKAQMHDSNKQEIRRTSSGSKIPKFNDNLKSPNQSFVETKDLQPARSGVEGSKIPTNFGRKPWIFGSHKNARVVSYI